MSAAREEAPAAGALPDPSVGVSARGEDYPGGGIGEMPMAMAGLEVSQAFPWPGKRGRRQAAADAAIDVSQSRLEARRRRLAAEVHATYAQVTATLARERALAETRSLIDLLLPGTTARYATGEATQLAVVSLQIERSRVEADVDELAATLADQRARLAALLDAPPDVLPPLDAGLPPVDDAAVAGITPDDLAEIALADAAQNAARLRAEAAESEDAPDLMVAAEYGWRDALPPLLTARVGVQLPLWQGRKQDAVARAARREEAMAAAERRDALAQAGAELTGLRARYSAAQSQVARLRTSILPQAALAVDSARAAYATGAVTSVELIEALRQLTESRALLAEREADRYAAWSTLRALAGQDLPEELR